MSANFLITGFEPFGEHVRNSSWDALELLGSRLPASCSTRRLPVDHLAAHTLLRGYIDVLAPRAVLCTGLAKGLAFRVERRARRPLALEHEGGEATLFGRWPWPEMRTALEVAAVPHFESDDAGRFVCESTYWSLLDFAAQRSAPEFAAFLHVPPVCAEFPLERIAAGVLAVINARRSALSAMLLGE